MQLGSIKRYERVEGSPFQPGDRVQITQAVDAEVDVHPVTGRAYIGLAGVVEYLEYDCGCGQRFPDEPMIGVLIDGEVWSVGEQWQKSVRISNKREFWPEELEAG